MKVILIDWNAYGNEHMEKLMRDREYTLKKFPFDSHWNAEKKSDATKDLRDTLGSFEPDFVFSYHYFPEISNACEEAHVIYISWIYDSPAFDLYSPTILNSVNRVFVFDRGVYEEFATGGITTVHYMPLGVVPRRGDSSTSLRSAQNDMGRSGDSSTPLRSAQNDMAGNPISYKCDISFVGSLYTEPKHRLYDRFKDIAPYAHGYLDACIEAQKHLYGANILESLITPEIEAEMQKAYPTDPNSVNAMTPAKIYSQFVLSRQVTALERMDILQLLGRWASDSHSANQASVTTASDSSAPDIISTQCSSNTNNPIVHLYTHDTTLRIPGIKNMGPVEYGKPMYDIFATSKINLNITLRSILTGIPLRALDIMSAGGFLLSNYQEELCEYFVPGEEFDFYSDYDDLMTKIEYYLSHDKERADIAQNGYERVMSEHTLDKRLDELLTYI